MDKKSVAWKNRNNVREIEARHTYTHRKHTMYDLYTSCIYMCWASSSPLYRWYGITYIQVVCYHLYTGGMVSPIYRWYAITYIQVVCYTQSTIQYKGSVDMLNEINWQKYSAAIQSIMFSLTSLTSFVRRLSRTIVRTAQTECILRCAPTTNGRSHDSYLAR